MTPLPSEIGIILGSASRYRLGVLLQHGLSVTTVAPEVDETALRRQFAEDCDGAGAPTAETIARRLAEAKLDNVLQRCTPPREGTTVLVCADQVGEVASGKTTRLLTKAQGPDVAVEQLMRLSGVEHFLVNAIAVAVPGTARRSFACNRHSLRMRDFDEAEARAYVDAFTPFDTTGSYRIEDDADLLDSIDGFRVAEGVPQPIVESITGMPVELLEASIHQLLGER